jgi:hypothetical protein
MVEPMAELCETVFSVGSNQRIHLKNLNTSLNQRNAWEYPITRLPVKSKSISVTGLGGL